MLRFSGKGMTDVGRVREANEDSAFLGPYVALVADGVGGAAAGEVASATVAYVVSAIARLRHDQDPAEVLRDAIEAARESLQTGIDADLQRAGMATTLTALVTDGTRVVLGHLGDSRGYLLRAGSLRQITTDHTYVQQMIAAGQLVPEQARSHPWRNVVMRSLHGGPAEVDQAPDIVSLDLGPGDRVLLCSDGLTDLVTDQRIAELLRPADAEAAATGLVEAALEAGGTDNVTCLVIDVVDGPRVNGDGELLGAVRDVVNIVDPGAVRAN
jgi:PPM family protein phosphatase